MSGAHVYPHKKLLKMDEDPAAIEQELLKKLFLS
jgi:hypothetical protein